MGAVKADKHVCLFHYHCCQKEIPIARGVPSVSAETRGSILSKITPHVWSTTHQLIKCQTQKSGIPLAQYNMHGKRLSTRPPGPFLQLTDLVRKQKAGIMPEPTAVKLAPECFASMIYDFAANAGMVIFSASNLCPAFFWRFFRLMASRLFFRRKKGHT